MSTRGIAHHQRGTFPQLDSAELTQARAARYAARDAAYRAALRLGADEPLPNDLGNVGGRALRHGYRATASGGRLRVSGLGN